jgi:hypothetical protein
MFYIFLFELFARLNGMMRSPCGKRVVSAAGQYPNKINLDLVSMHSHTEHRGLLRTRCERPNSHLAAEQYELAAARVLTKNLPRAPPKL